MKHITLWVFLAIVMLGCKKIDKLNTAKISILAKALGGANDLPTDAIEKLINIREKAGYLDESARCQSCGYLHETGITCEVKGNSNGAKISFSREELIELLNQVVQLKN